jgi:hypothetical protein
VTPAARTAFWRAYFVSASLFFAVSSFGLAYLWAELDDYERGTPDYAIKALLRHSGANALPPLFAQNAATPGEFEDSQVKEAALLSWLGGAEVSYRRSAEASDVTQGTEVFIIKAASADLAAVTLKKIGSGRFGRWETASVDYRLPIFGTLRILAPSNAKIRINGRDLPKSARIGYYPYGVLANLPESCSPVPTQRVFKVSGLYRKPSLEAADFSGNPLPLEWKEDAKGVRSAVFHPACPEHEKNGFAKMAIADAKIYSFYMSRDAAFTNLSRRMLRDSAIYTYMATMDTRFYARHIGVEFKDETVSNFRKFSPSLLAVDIDYTYQVTQARNRQHSFQTKATFVYWKPEKIWLIADIIIR